MASLRKTLWICFSRIAKSTSSSIADASASATTSPSLTHRLLSGGNCSFTFFQKRPTFQLVVPDRFYVLSGDLLSERIHALNPSRIRLDGLLPPSALEPETRKVTAEEVRKVGRAAQMQAARAALRATRQSRISYAEFLDVYGVAAGEDKGGPRLCGRSTSPTTSSYSETPSSSDQKSWCCSNLSLYVGERKHSFLQFD